MTEKFLDLSAKIDETFIEIFESIAEIANSLKISFFIIGAAARDIILIDGYGMDAQRVTMDVDLGVNVENWDQFEQLTKNLVSSGKFKSTGAPQRFRFKDDFPVDLVPFGPISEPKGSIAWPPSGEVEMSSLGFEESYAHAVWVRFRSDPPLEIRVASLCGLAAMKLIAWEEQYPERKKDARDLDLILRKYIEAGNEDRIFSGDASDLLEHPDFDYELASAQLLGRDLALILKAKTKKKILEILNRETGHQSNFKLTQDMVRSTFGIQESLEEHFNLITSFKKGLARI